MKVDERVHGDTTGGGVFKYPLPEYRVTKTDYPNMNHGYLECSYCGSLHPKAALELLQKGVYASGSDWKYGYPHKFYIQAAENGRGKFYSRHLYDADEQTLIQLTSMLALNLGITFEIDEKGIKYKAPYHGYQTWVNSHMDDEAPKDHLVNA